MSKKDCVIELLKAVVLLQTRIEAMEEYVIPRLYHDRTRREASEVMADILRSKEETP